MVEISLWILTMGQVTPGNIPLQLGSSRPKTIDHPLVAAPQRASGVLLLMPDSI